MERIYLPLLGLTSLFLGSLYAFFHDPSGFLDFGPKGFDVLFTALGTLAVGDCVDGAIGSTVFVGQSWGIAFQWVDVGTMLHGLWFFTSGCRRRKLLVLSRLTVYRSCILGSTVRV